MRDLIQRLACRPLALLGALLALGGCEEAGVGTRFADIGSPERGALYIEQVGCGSCHMIPGIDGAGGLVGPPLDHMGQRIFIAGLLRDTPANMVTWLRYPQQVVPGNAMPDMGLSEGQARDITAYLYTLDSSRPQPGEPARKNESEAARIWSRSRPNRRARASSSAAPARLARSVRRRRH